MNVDKLMQYEQGDMDAYETVDLFADLIRTGHAWTLQGHYGRMAARMIEDGIIDRDGVVDYDVLEEVLESC